jgi:hypothetical protein
MTKAEYTRHLAECEAHYKTAMATGTLDDQDCAIRAFAVLDQWYTTQYDVVEDTEGY